MHITFQSLICDSCSLRIPLLWQSVSGPFFFLLVITPCGWRLGKRRLQQPITVVSLSRRRVPTVCGPSLQSEKHPLCCGSPICQDHSFQIGVTLSRGLVSAFQRAMIAAKADKKKAKMQKILNLFWRVVPPLGFLHLLISWSHFPFIQGLLAPYWPLLFYSLISFTLDVRPALHYLFTVGSPSAPPLPTRFPSFLVPLLARGSLL